MIQQRDNWASGSRFTARLAAVERMLRRETLNKSRWNTALLDTIEACISLDIWDGVLGPDEVAARFRTDFTRGVEHLGLRPDASLGERVERLQEWARQSTRPPA